MNKHNYIENSYLKTKKLVETLELISTNSFLHDSFVIKGGCAIHFHFPDYKRLFFDVDIDKTGEKPRLEIKDNIIRLMETSNLSVSKKSRFNYSTDSLIFNFQKENGNNETIKYDINHSYPEHILDGVEIPIFSSTFKTDKTIKALDKLELLGIKIVTFQGKGDAKDLLDINTLLTSVDSSTDLDLLRKIILFYYHISKANYSLISLENIRNLNNYNANKQIGPIIPKKEYPNFDLIKKKYEEFIKDILIFTKDEETFSKYFERGVYEPTLLFDDEKLIERIKDQPILTYKTKLRKQ